MYHSIKDIINISDEKNKPFWQVVMENDMQERGVTADISYAAMEKLYAAMKKADDDYRAERIHSRSLGRMSGGDRFSFRHGSSGTGISSGRRCTGHGKCRWRWRE